MSDPRFVHLRLHSEFSISDGIVRIDQAVARAAADGMPALALTDHGAMFGAVEFYQEARKAGIKPLVGMEAYVTRGKLTDRTPGDKAHHLVLLARDERGFRNLMRLASLAYLEGFYYKPRVDHHVLSQHAEGLLALSACPQGEVAVDLLEDRDEALRLFNVGLMSLEHRALVDSIFWAACAKIRDVARGMARPPEELGDLETAPSPACPPYRKPSPIGHGSAAAASWSSFTQASTISSPAPVLSHTPCAMSGCNAREFLALPASKTRHLRYF